MTSDAKKEIPLFMCLESSDKRSYSFLLFNSRFLKTFPEILSRSEGFICQVTTFSMERRKAQVCDP